VQAVRALWGMMLLVAFGCIITRVWGLARLMILCCGWGTLTLLRFSGYPTVTFALWAHVSG